MLLIFCPDTCIPCVSDSPLLAGRFKHQEDRMSSTRKILLRTISSLCLILAGVWLYSEYLSEEGRFRHHVMERLTKLQRGEIPNIPLASIERDLKLICIFGPYQGGGQQVSKNKHVSAWIQSLDRWSLEDMPMAKENDFLFVFGSDEKLIAIEIPWRQIDLKGSDQEVFNQSCWKKPDPILKSLRLEPGTDSMIKIRASR
jgi:hypothetical protein